MPPKPYFKNAQPGPDRYSIELPTQETIGFDLDGFNDLIRSHGITFIHSQAMICPVGLQDTTDTVRSHGDHIGCENGFIYHVAGEITGFFSSNRLSRSLTDQGMLDDSTATVSFPLQYDRSDKEFQALPYDKFHIKDLPGYASMTQLVNYNNSGLDKLRFLAEEVTHDIIDTNGAIYYPNVDFRIENGSIRWIPGGNAPGWNPMTNKGLVYSVRYTYVPHWYNIRNISDLRVARKDDFLGGPNPNNGPAKLVRLPYCCALQREYVFRDMENDKKSLTPDNPRMQSTPQQGSLGPT